LEQLADKEVEIAKLRKQLAIQLAETRPSRNAVNEVGEMTSLLMHARSKIDGSEARLTRENKQLRDEVATVTGLLSHARVLVEAEREKNKRKDAEIAALLDVIKYSGAKIDTTKVPKAVEN